MAEGLSLSAFPMFDTQTDPTSIGPRWRKWMVRFENRIKAMNLTDPERKLALLLDYAGEDVHDDFLTLTVPPAQAAAAGNDPPGNDIYHRSIVAHNTHYAPQVQREYEVFSFRTAKQEEGESLDQFVTKLRKLGATCDFANLSSEIKSQVIQKCRSSRLRTKGLSDLTMSLEDLIKAGNAMDRAVAYTKSMEGDTARSVNQLVTREFTKQPSHSKNQPTEMCGHCGRSYPHEGGRESCPAFKQSCHNCGTIGHYAKLCRKPQANSHGQNRGQDCDQSSNRGHGRSSRGRNQLHNLDVTEVDNHEDDYLYTVDTREISNSKPMFLVQLNGVPTKMLGDSGASVNVIDELTLETLAPKPVMQPPDMNLFAYGSKEKALPLRGMFVGTIATEQFTHTTKVYVARGNYGTLMSHHTAEKLNLITINQEAVLANMKINSNAEPIAEEFSERFEGLGNLAKVKVEIHLNPDVTPVIQVEIHLNPDVTPVTPMTQVQIHLNPDVMPVIQPHRRIPFHLRQNDKHELQHLEDMDVIERVTQPKSWVSSLVAAPKPNYADAVRLGVDMRSVNIAVPSEQDVMPTVDDIISDRNGATKLDLNQGYHQLELTPETRDATTDPAKVESIIQIEKPTKVPPATAMIGREINIRLPLTSNRKTTAIERRVKANAVAAKQPMKTYTDERKHTRHANITDEHKHTRHANIRDERKHTRHANITDEHRHTRHANITVGDKVLIMEKKNGRKSFNPKIYTVTRKTGSEIRAQRGQHVVTRNYSFFKVVHCREEEEDETSEYEFDDVLERRHHQQHNVQHPVRDTTSSA